MKSNLNLENNIYIKTKKIFDNNLEDIWNKIFQKSNTTPFQQYEWHKNWYENIGIYKNFELSILCIYYKNICISIFPFCVKKKLLKTVHWNGGLQTDYNIQLVKEEYNKEKIIEVIWSKIIKNYSFYDLILLDKIPATINEKENKLLNIINKIKTSNSYQIVLNKENLLNLYKTKIIKDNFRQIRRLKNLGKLKFVVSNSEGLNYLITEMMIKQKSLRYKSTKAWDMFSEINNRKFYYKLCNIKSFKYLKPHFSYLLLNDEVIATHFGLKNNNYFYYLMPSYNYKYGRYSTGKILLQYLIEWSFDNKIKYFDLTVGNESYKNNWAHKKFEIYQTKIAISFKGKILLKLLKYKSVFKKIPFLKKLYKKISNQ